MKLTIRVILTVLCAAVILGMPFFLTSPQKLAVQQDSAQQEEEMKNAVTEDEDSEFIDFSRLLFGTACAEDAPQEENDDGLIIETVIDNGLYIDSAWKLPIDEFAVSPRPNPDKYTENGYEDKSIRVSVEKREMYGITVDVAFVQIADASQLRTAVAGNAQNNETGTLEAIARKAGSLIAMNGDLYTEKSEKKTFEVRMREKIRAKTNNMKDILVIDDLGDFHLFIRSNGLHKDDKPYYIEQIKQEGRVIVNAFTFGPALVKDGELIDQAKNEKDYAYAPNYKNPRSAIGQTGRLQYVMVIVEGARETKDAGATIRELAQIMFDLGCEQAYALDGGNTAEMIMFGPEGADGKATVKCHFEADQVAKGGREQKDIIYFATAVPESEW